MASQDLFNRIVRVRIFRRGNQDPGSPKFLLEYTKHLISANFNKTFDIDVRATGTISITNISRAHVDLFASPIEANPMLYSFEAGYGDELHLVSEGYVTKITYRHDGPDVNVDFSVSEGHPLYDRRAEILGIKEFPKGTTLASIIASYKESGVPIEIDGGAEIRNDLKNIKLTSNVQADEDIQQSLNTIMNQYGYSISVVDSKLLATRQNSLPKSNLQDRRQLRGRSDANLIKLNFKTGLLKASLESIYASDIVKSYHYLSFKTLWISGLAPFSFIELNEESRYRNLRGLYIVRGTNISINNFTGSFYIDGTAVNTESEYSRDIYSAFRSSDLIRGARNLAGNQAQNAIQSISQFGLRKVFK